MTLVVRVLFALLLLAALGVTLATYSKAGAFLFARGSDVLLTVSRPPFGALVAIVAAMVICVASLLRASAR